MNAMQDSRAGAARSSLLISAFIVFFQLTGTAAAAVVQTLADGSLADEDGQPIVFAHRKLLERRLLESYGKRHALQISLGVVLSFMALKVALCGCWLGRRAHRDRQREKKRQMLDDCAEQQGPSDWEIDMADIKIVKRKNGEDWELGAGNFGKVLRGLRGDVQPVAIKTTFKRDKQMEDAFVREIAMMKYVSRDRNIVQFYGACVQTSALLMVSELMEGGDLRNALNADQDETWVWYGRGKSVCVDMARGLAFLHANKVIHRDLKSKNVLLTRDGVAKIGDVGMAKILSDGYLTRDGALGTMAWAAPELLLGEKCCQKVDVYSLGICLWEVVTQEVPMRGNLRDPVVPKECPQAIADLITACRQRDQYLRPTAKEVCRLLYQAEPVWEEPDDVRAMLEATDSDTIYTDEDVTAEVMDMTMTLDSADDLTDILKKDLVDIKEKPQLQTVVLDIKARLQATRSLTTPTNHSTSTNAAMEPATRPSTGPFAWEEARGPRDARILQSDSTNSGASYDTATLHDSRHSISRERLQ